MFFSLGEVVGVAVLDVLPTSNIRCYLQNMMNSPRNGIHDLCLRRCAISFNILVEVTLERVYNGNIIVNIFQFTMVKFTLVNFHGYGGKNKDDPSPITIGSTKKIGGYIFSLSKTLFCLSQPKKRMESFKHVSKKTYRNYYSKEDLP